MRSRLGTVGRVFGLTLLTFLLGTFAAAGLWLQPQWRSSEDTALALGAISVFGAPLVALTVAAVWSAPWAKVIKIASLVAYAAMVACYSLVYTVLAMPDWFTTIERRPGAVDVRQLTDTAEALYIGTWLSAVALAALLAVLLLMALVVPHRRSSADSDTLQGR